MASSPQRDVFHGRTASAGTRRGRSLSRRLRRLAVNVCGAGVAVILTLAGTSPAAANHALTVAQAKAEIAQLQTTAAGIDQQYAAVQDEIQQGRARLARTRSDLKAQTKVVAARRLETRRTALASYQNRELDTTLQLVLTEDTEGFLSQLSTVQKVADNQNMALQDFQQELARLSDLRRSADTELAGLQEQEKQLEAVRRESAQKVTQAEAVLARLTAGQRQQLADDAKEESEAARVAVEGGERDGKTAAAERTAESDAEATGGGRGAKALAFARTQLGKPYRFGATGPGAYDCSGLTGAAWRSAGISVPRTTQQQYGALRPVAKSDLRPGDIVFFYGDISHNGLYAGNGMLLHSPRPGKSVEYIKMSYMPYAGARRPA